MFEPKLAQPRKKKRPRYTRRPKHASNDKSFATPTVLQQPFPIPISSLTGIKASNSVWRWYRGNLKKRVKLKSQNKCCDKEPSLEPLSAKQDDESLYYFVEITSENEAHSILSQMGFFGETEENIVSYRSTIKSEVKYDTYVSLDNFVPKIETNTQEKILKNELSKEVPIREDPELELKDRPSYLRLELWEAFFLTYGLGCLIISNCDNDNEDMSIDDMWEKFCQVSDYFRLKYAVYHHFRSKGWVVKDGSKFGADFLLYKDGPPFYHASYSVWLRKPVKNTNTTVDKELPDLDWTSLSGLNRVTESASKELLLIDIFEPDDVNEKVYSVTNYLSCIKLEEVLVRRWVASTEKQDVD